MEILASRTIYTAVTGPRICFVLRNPGHPCCNAMCVFLGERIGENDNDADAHQDVNRGEELADRRDSEKDRRTPQSTA